MDFATLAFLFFAAAATISAIAVISLRNPVHAVLSLVLTFFSVACTWISTPMAAERLRKRLMRLVMLPPESGEF